MIKEFEARFCSETPFLGRRWVFDRDKEQYVQRLYEGRLQVQPDKMFAHLNTPNGVPVLWQHYDYATWNFPPAIGTIRSMEFGNKELLGKIAINEADVLAVVPGGFEAIEAGFNRGLSVGLQFLDNPPVTWKMKEGTREKPDQMTYGAVLITEISLTPMPRISNAGILNAVVTAGEAEPTEEP